MDEKDKDEKGRDEKGRDEKGRDEKGRKEWKEYSEHERNCLMWPDFLVWGPASDVKICRNDQSGSFGIVSVTVQDEEKRSWYNVTKKIKEKHPAYGHVNPCEWIFKVNGRETAGYPNKEFSSLMKNGGKVVRLSIKKPVDPLTEFVKKWGEEKTVTLKLSQETDFQKRCRFVHFYSKDDCGIVEDRILVWEAKRGTGTSELILHRGEELLEVNGEPVAGKKLAQIYKLILDQAPAAVELKMKAVQPNMSGVEETSKHSVLQENHSNSPDSSLAEDKAVFDDTYCLVEEKEMDTKAGRKASEILVNNAAFKNSSEIIAQPQTEPDSSEIQKSPPGNKKKSRPKRLSLRRSLSSNKPHCEDAGGSISPTSVENVAYSPTPPPQRKSLMCGECVKKDESQLPDDRNNWPIYKMEIGCLGKIYKLLDLDDRSAESLMVALGGFSVNDADLIKKECRPTGCGIAKKALGKWGTSNKKNNVGALKKILEETMQRMDVVDVIEDWKKLRVCHGCGVKLN